MNVEWIVNDLGELGVKLPDGSCHFLYKGESYACDPDDGDAWGAKKYRPVQKREFGEVCRVAGFKPQNDLGLPVQYEEGDGWKPLPSLKVG